MKAIKILSLFLLFPFCIFGQESEKVVSKSQTVELLEKEGVLLKKEFFEIGSFSGIKFENLVITNLSDGSITKALRIETTTFASYGTETSVGILDIDEIDGCLKSIISMKGNVLSEPATNYTECLYISKDGVKIGAFSKSNDWSLFINPKRYTERSMKSFSLSKIDDLINILKKSLDDFKSK